MTDYIDKCKCHIYSLNGELAEATIIKKMGDNHYLADYNGVKCSAMFIPFAKRYYVDDKYGIIRDSKKYDRDR